jgi:hypothetical protein
VTFARLAVIVLLILSGVLAFYGMVLDRSGQNITFTVIGLLVFGLCLVFVAAWLLSRALADARNGRTAGALVGGVAGGLCAIGAAMALAAASVFAIVTGL